MVRIRVTVKVRVEQGLRLLQWFKRIIIFTLPSFTKFEVTELR